MQKISDGFRVQRPSPLDAALRQEHVLKNRSSYRMRPCFFSSLSLSLHSVTFHDWRLSLCHYHIRLPLIWSTTALPSITTPERNRGSTCQDLPPLLHSVALWPIYVSPSLQHLMHFLLMGNPYTNLQLKPIEGLFDS